MIAPDLSGYRRFSQPVSADSSSDLELTLYVIWSLSNLESIKTIPRISFWAKKFRNALEIVSIHSPQFEFETQGTVLENALKRYSVFWPVFDDKDKEIFRKFGAVTLPAFYIANKKGEIVYEHFSGEGLNETERQIIKLLGDREDKFNEPESDHTDYCFKATQDIFLGYGRGVFSVKEGGSGIDTTSEYDLPDSLAPDSAGLKGMFHVDKNYIESSTAGSEMHIKFHASEVYIVLEPIEPTDISVLLNKDKVPQDLEGKDIVASGLIIADEPRVYSLIKGNKELKGELTVLLQKGHIRAYVFSFSGCRDHKNNF